MKGIVKHGFCNTPGGWDSGILCLGILVSGDLGVGMSEFGIWELV